MTACSNNSSNNENAEKAEPQNVEETANEALNPVYDDTADPMLQLDAALRQAGEEGKYVIAQVGGNWCPWCLRFADFITKDDEINDIVTEAFVYVHINAYSVDEAGKRVLNDDVMARLGNPMRFGYPVLVVLDAQGNILHTQDSGMLEEGNGYNHEIVKRFFELWQPKAMPN